MKDKKEKMELEDSKNPDTVSEDTDCIDRETLGDDKYIEALELKLGEAINEATTCKGVAQRLQADFDNYRKRNQSLAEEMKQLEAELAAHAEEMEQQNAEYEGDRKDIRFRHIR